LKKKEKKNTFPCLHSLLRKFVHTLSVEIIEKYCLKKIVENFLENLGKIFWKFY